MPEVTVSVVCRGRVQEQITRPLRSLDGQPAVTYKKILRPLQDGCIYLDSVPLRPNGNGPAIPVFELPRSEESITVQVVQKGRIREQITRPIRSVNGRPAVTYKKTLWPVRNGHIYLDEGALERSAPKRESAPGVNPMAGIELKEAAPPLAPEKIEWDASQKEVIEEAHLDPASILAGVERFAKDHDQRIARQRKALGA